MAEEKNYSICSSCYKIVENPEKKIGSHHVFCNTCNDLTKFINIVGYNMLKSSLHWLVRKINNDEECDSEFVFSKISKKIPFFKNYLETTEIIESNLHWDDTPGITHDDFYRFRDFIQEYIPWDLRREQLFCKLIEKDYLFISLTTRKQTPSMIKAAYKQCPKLGPWFKYINFSQLTTDDIVEFKLLKIPIFERISNLTFLHRYGTKAQLISIIRKMRNGEFTL